MTQKEDKKQQMRINMDTDFLDYYDHWFVAPHENADARLDRMSRTSMTKQNQFWFMEQKGLMTPANGRVADFAANGFNLDFLYVVYTDPYAHRGEGKERMSLREANEWHKDSWCSKWVGGNVLDGYAPKPMSYRVLGVGDLRFSLIYRGSEGWMSNHAREVEVTWDRDWKFPVDTSRFGDEILWAVDFVQNEWGDYLAVDFNTAPQIRGTGIEDVYQPREIYDAIEAKVKQLGFM